MAYKVKSKKSKPVYSSSYSEPRVQQRITYDLYIQNQKFLNFETKKDAEWWFKDAQKRGRFKGEKFLVIPRTSRNFQIGDMWRDDFDYVGMVKTGSEARANWGINRLNKLFESYESVNYHSESGYLYSAILNLKEGNKAEAEKNLAKFRSVNKSLLKKWHTK